MGTRNRSTLKNYFKEGALPSADEFSELIDSTLNMVDEGFAKSPAHGLEISPPVDYESLISFFRSNDPDHKHPVWSISYDRDQDKLLFNKIDKEDGEKPILSLNREKWSGQSANVFQPEVTIDGAIQAEGVIGGYRKEQKVVPADGHMHTIAENLRGCQAFNVMAGAGGEEGKGKYALMHAVAMNAFNPTGWFFNIFFKNKKQIKYHHAYYRARSDKLKLRWEPQSDGAYCLKLGANCDYGNNRQIRYFITRLWFDDYMKECTPSDVNTQV